jgi:hypothetical protein
MGWVRVADVTLMAFGGESTKDDLIPSRICHYSKTILLINAATLMAFGGESIRDDLIPSRICHYSKTIILIIIYRLKTF